MPTFDGGFPHHLLICKERVLRRFTNDIVEVLKLPYVHRLILAPPLLPKENAKDALCIPGFPAWNENADPFHFEFQRKSHPYMQMRCLDCLAKRHSEQFTGGAVFLRLGCYNRRGRTTPSSREETSSGT